MRLSVTSTAAAQHKEFVTGIAWTASGEVLSSSDDKTVCKWTPTGDCGGELMKIDAYITCMHAFPAKKGASGDVFLLSFTDGSFGMYNKQGREEWRSKDAHKGAVISLRWSREGNAIVTAGEDGCVRVWSRTGMLRSQLAALAAPVYALAWGSDGDRVAFSSGKDVVIKPLQPAGKHVQWSAHEHSILCMDWGVGNLITGGEDCRFKVWDAHGRLLHCSQPLEHPVTSIAWSSSGDVFAVGSYNCKAPLSLSWNKNKSVTLAHVCSSLKPPVVAQPRPATRAAAC